jgi:hypothetical protein
LDPSCSEEGSVAAGSFEQGSKTLGPTNGGQSDYLSVLFSFSKMTAARSRNFLIGKYLLFMQGLAQKCGKTACDTVPLEIINMLKSVVKTKYLMLEILNIFDYNNSYYYYYIICLLLLLQGRELHLWMKVT